jgi:SAM-dependent methyltransferase
VLKPTVRGFASWRHLVTDRVALEIGGPSTIFCPGRLLPVYPLLCGLDNCNFSEWTVWEGPITEGRNFQYSRGREPGLQYVREATDLHGIADARYDVILSSHALEHVANPLKALREWRRVLMENGVLLIVLPHRDGTFDRRRPVTTIEHLRSDFAQDVPESDLTHLPEVLALHDLGRDPEAGSRERFEARCRDNIMVRCIHHHVFDSRVAAELVAEAGFDVHSVEATRPFHIVIVARKASALGRTEASKMDAVLDATVASSPFRSDHS